MRHKRKSVGIIGGLCPLATADIYFKAMRKVKAGNGDIDYPDIIINAAIEQEYRGNMFDDAHNYDMSHRILYVYQVAAELQRQRVGRILIPDFLTYNSINSLSRNLQTPIIDIVAVLARHIRRNWPMAHSVGVMTTRTSIRNNTFENEFSRCNLRIIYPDDDVQSSAISEAIYGPDGVKRGITSGKPGELIQKACGHLFDKGADVIATAVTELPLIDRSYYPPDRYVDCNEAIGGELIFPHDEYPPSTEKQCIVGIIGGLGPAATVDIFDKIVRHTPAECDQDHIKIIIENNPQIPDRTAAIYEKGDDPSMDLMASAEKLRRSGADFIIVPCNTAHAFLKSIQRHVDIPILSITEEAAKFIARKHAKIRNAGLLATSGTIRSGVYDESLAKAGINLIVPSAHSQQMLVMDAIYGALGIKAGNRSAGRELLLRAAQELIHEGAQVIILGCTEIPLVIRDGDADVPFVDPTDILAMATVDHALGRIIPFGMA